MIRSVEKRKRRVNGILKVARLYSLRYRIGDMPCDKWVALGVADKTVALAKAADFTGDLEREMAGLGIPKMELKTSNVPLKELIEEYRMELATRGRDANYVASTAKRIACIAADCKWIVLRNVTADSFMVWRRNQSLQSKTLNDCLSDVRSFLQWLVELGRLASNQLSKLTRITVKDDEEEKRRAFPWKEVEALVSVSGKRAIIYQTTLYCGLRRSEVSELVWGDVQLDRNGATFLKLRASTGEERENHLAACASVAGGIAV